MAPSDRGPGHGREPANEPEEYLGPNPAADRTGEPPVDPLPPPSAAAADLAAAVERCRDVSDFLALWLERPRLPPAEQAVFEHYYGSYVRRFPARVRRHYADQTRELMQALGERPGARVLEVGCGCGTESLWMALHGARVHGVDIREDRLDVARARRDLLSEALGLELPCTFERRSVLELDLEPVDIIWMENTFHHLEPRAQVVRRLADLLRPGGRVIVAEVNALNLPLQLSFLRQRGLKTIDVHVDAEGRPHPYGVERITTARNLARLFARAGVRRLSTRHFRLLPNHRLFDPLAPLEALAGRRLLRPLATTYTYVGERPAASR